METSLFTCLVLLCCWAYACRPQAIWGALAGLAVLTRPDALLLVLLLALHDTWTRLRARGWRHDATWTVRDAVAWKAAAAFLLICMPWWAWGTLYFGQPIPQSMLAKGSGL
jgi:hypothetical protein